MGKIILLIILILIAVYLVFIVFPGFGSCFMVFGRKKGTRLDKEYISHSYYAPYEERMLQAEERIRGLSHEIISIESTRDGVKLCGYFIDQKSDKTIAFTHGYRSDYIDQFAVAASRFYDEGYNLLFICNRGHGISGGKHTSLGIIEQYDILDWAREIKRRGCEKIVLYGISMGCASIGFATDRLDESVKAVILDCGFDSLYHQMLADAKKWHVPFLTVAHGVVPMARLLLGVNIKQSVQSSMKKAKTPAFFIHGEDDESVYVKYGRANYEVYAGPKEALFVPNARHTVGLLEGGKAAEDQVIHFIDKYMK